MKKHLLLFVFVLAASVVRAQNGELYSILYQDTLGSDTHINFMQQRDGDFIANLFTFENTGNFNYFPMGSWFFKISANTLTVSDSLFVADTIPYYFLARDPQGEGNIRARLEYHEDCDSTFFRISHFPDNDLHSNPNEDIVTPLCEGYASGGVNVQIDHQGDMILSYIKFHGMAYDSYLARFDSNGTLKQQALWLENCMNSTGAMGVLKESPLQFYQWGRDNEYPSNLIVYTIDSLFHGNSTIISYILNEEVIDPYTTAYEYFLCHGDTHVIPAGGDDILVAAKYVSDTNFFSTAEYGVVVAKYNLRTTQLKDYIVFNDYSGGYYSRVNCMGLKMMSDGTVYLLYKEEGYPEGSVIIVKMDADLNVEWKRFCKTDNIILEGWFEYSVVFEDEHGEETGIAWMGSGRMAENDYISTIYFFLNHEGPVNCLDKYGIEVRPYCFYPNPAHDQLRLQFSPDVQPAQVELYDLQGCLVRTQRSNFEHIDMSQLPAGAYTMRVIMEDGKAYSDKVVKE